MGKIEVEQTSLPGVLLITPQIFKDERGFFIESYNYQDFSDAGISDIFVQDNHSKSQKGVLRGLHYQNPHPQGKLVRVIRGKIFDVVVDIRAGSPTFGKYIGVTLTNDSPKMLFVPVGFAHGFLVLDDDTEVLYKVTDLYYPKGDAGIRWDDPDVGISWPCHEFGIDTPVLSEKDKIHPYLRDVQTPFSYLK